MKTIKEMNDDYANGGYKSTEDPTVPAADPSVDLSIVVGHPSANPSVDSQHVSVFADTIKAVSYTSDSSVVAFDVVFSVTCSYPETGKVETYQVVKRIGVDKMKLLNDAKSSVPISIVEQEQPKKELAPEKFIVSKERARAIAGLK